MPNCDVMVILKEGGRKICQYGNMTAQSQSLEVPSDMKNFKTTVCFSKRVQKETSTLKDPRGN